MKDHSLSVWAARLAVIMGVLLGGCNFTPNPQSSPTASLVPTRTPTPLVGGHVNVTPATSSTPCPTLELEVTVGLVMDIPNQIHDVYRVAGRIPLTVATDSAPQKVRGEADLPVSGEGYLHRGCTFTHDGVVTYFLEGEILTRPDGERDLVLHLSGKANVITTGENCSGDGGAPLDPAGEIRLAYRDGEVWAWKGQPATFVQSEQSWTLHVLCKE